MPTATDLVTVAAYGTAREAEEARAHLAENGIRAVVAEVEGGAGLQVLRADAGPALEMLRSREAALREASGEEALVEDEADSACIACGAAIPEYLDRCPACGWSYS